MAGQLSVGRASMLSTTITSVGSEAIFVKHRTSFPRSATARSGRRFASESAGSGAPSGRGCVNASLPVLARPAPPVDNVRHRKIQILCRDPLPRQKNRDNSCARSSIVCLFKMIVPWPPTHASGLVSLPQRISPGDQFLGGCRSATNRPARAAECGDKSRQE